jgi:IS30 family transposase
MKITRDEMFKRTKELLAKNWTVSEIAKELGRAASTIAEVRRTLTREGEVRRPDYHPAPVTLARVSILETDMAVTEADYVAGVRARQEAGL